MMEKSSDVYTERMIPEEADKATFWEHIYRYRFASKLVANKRVLDIACGDGYGTASLLKAGAQSVIGVDISAQTCERARNKYGVDARVGSAEQIPLPDHCVDLVVSFETVEHLNNPSIFLKECSRVLVPNGHLLISTPNRDIYNHNPTHNPFHTFEWDLDEFISALSVDFQSIKLFTQLPSSVAWWSTRSWVVNNSPWFRIKGFWRLVDFVRRHTSPYLLGKLNPRYSTFPVEAILANDHPLSFLVNPYMVRSRWAPYYEKSKYLIALANVKKSLKGSIRKT